MRLIAQMVCRDEADRYLEEVLDHISKYVDEIVYTDDASSDNSPEIAREYTDNIYVNPESMFGIHEGRLRQSAWNNLENHAREGDWILCIDADEKIFFTHSPLKNLLEQKRFSVIPLLFVNMWNTEMYRKDSTWKPHNCTKLFRYAPGGRIANRQMACGSEPTYVNDWVRNQKMLPNSGLIIQHLGYVRDEDKRIKYDRYMEIDGGKFHSGAHLQSIISPKVELERWTSLRAQEVTSK